MNPLLPQIIAFVAVISAALGLEGSWAPRARLFCRSEVTVIDMVPIGNI